MTALVLVVAFILVLALDHFGVIDLDTWIAAVKGNQGVRDVVFVAGLCGRFAWGVTKWVLIIGLCCSGIGCVVGIPWMLHEVAKADYENYMAGD